MARAQPSKPSPTRKPPPPPPERRPVGRFVAKLLLHGLILTAFVGGLAYAATAGRQYLQQQPGVRQLTVELENRPVWMSDYLARQIAASVPRHAASPFDHQLLVDVAERLAADPWVRQVRQVRRKYGQSPGDTLAIDCDYRAPVALVRWRDYYWLVDNDGFKLPAPFSAAELPQVTAALDGHTALRVVTGVRSPPPEDGHRWPGGDLAAALDVAKLFHGKDYLDGVTGIDVTNFGGRIARADPQVVLMTTYGTQVWWGRPPLADDFFVEVPVARKLAVLRAVVRQFGRVDGGKAWLDVRFETGLLPADPPDPAPADAH